MSPRVCNARPSTSVPTTGSCLIAHFGVTSFEDDDDDDDDDDDESNE